MMLWGVGLNWVDNEKPAFPTIDFTDRRLPMKELIYAISVGDDHVAYSKEFIQAQGNIINVTVGGRSVVIAFDPALDCVTAFFNTTGGPVTSVDTFGNLPDGNRLARVNTLKSRLFWFIFVEFFPTTDVNRT
jgi:hypothetical protein